jgi:hypothetical protein
MQFSILKMVRQCQPAFHYCKEYQGYIWCSWELNFPLSVLAYGRGHYHMVVTRLLAGCWHSSERGKLVGGEALCTHCQMLFQKHLPWLKLWMYYSSAVMLPVFCSVHLAAVTACPLQLCTVLGSSTNKICGLFRWYLVAWFVLHVPDKESYHIPGEDQVLVCGSLMKILGNSKRK